MKNIESIVTKLCDELMWNSVRAFLSSLSDLAPRRTPGAGASSPKRAQPRAARAPNPDAGKISPLDLLPTPRRPNSRRADPAPSATRPKTRPAVPVEALTRGPVLRATLATPATLALVEAIVDALRDGPLYSEDLRRELNISRRELARPLAEALRRRRIVKRGARRETVYELA